MSLLTPIQILPDSDWTLLLSGKKSLLCYGLSISDRNKFLRYSISSNPNSSMSVCKAGLRCIIFERIICGVSVIKRKSAMSNPFFRYSSVAHCSNVSLIITFEQTEKSIAILDCQISFAPKSGHNITVRPFNTPTASALKQPCIPPVASHINSGI